VEKSKTVNGTIEEIIMITNTGKSIMAKYLVGQSPAYASYIAIGCGAKPLKGLSFGISNKAKTGFVATLTSSNHGLSVGQVVDVEGLGSPLDGTFPITAVTTNTFSYDASVSGTISSTLVSDGVAYAYPNFKDKTRLDFETIRVPIISRGFVNEGDLAKIVLTAELPTADRYEISEIGVFSALGNSLASNSDSRSLYSFSANEGWAYHSAADNSAISIPVIPGKLDGVAGDNSISDDVVLGRLVFQSTASNTIFLSDYRTKRFEQPRFLDNTIFMSGQSSKLDVNSLDGVLSVDPEWTDGDTFKSNHIHLTNAQFNFDNNSVIDELKFAFSVVSKNEDGNDPLQYVPENVRVMIEFTSNDSYGEGQYARFEVDLYDTNATGLPTERKNVVVADLSKNRYFSVTKKIEELTKSAGFSWDLVKNVKVYASVLDSDGDPSPLYYVCLDGLRFENTSTENPLYGMVGYTIVNNNENQQPRTIIKPINSTNYVEFRFAVDV
jgi:hypothetical protein